MKLLNLLPKQPKECGGSLEYNLRQHTRTLSSKKVLHLVFKCHGNKSNNLKPRNNINPSLNSTKNLKVGSKSNLNTIDLFKNRNHISSVLVRQAQLANIRIYKYSIQRNHIHLAIQASDRNSYNRFVRSFCGIISRKYGRGLWKQRPYTRIVEWGQDYRNLENYIYRNELEATGVISYQLRFQKN